MTNPSATTPGRTAGTATGGSPAQRKAQRKREIMLAREADERRRRLSSANLDVQPGTAQWARPFDVIGRDSNKRASVNHLNNCLRKKEDRTNPRILAWAKADELFSRVHQGDFPEPRFEPGVDSSPTPGNVNVFRLEAVNENAGLLAFLGRDSHALLHRVVFGQENYREIAGPSGDERLVAGMFKRALDETANFFGVGDDSSFARHSGPRDER